MTRTEAATAIAAGIVIGLFALTVYAFAGVWAWGLM